MKEEGLGLKFWLAMIGIVVAVGVGGLIFFLIFTRAVYAWGFLGAVLALGLVFILFAWLHDRRQKRRWDELEAETE
jgi:predicted PurR-regulated permease PerM